VPGIRVQHPTHKNVRFTVVEVDDLPLTGRGKFKFIEQLIPEDVQARAVNEGS